VLVLCAAGVLLISACTDDSTADSTADDASADRSSTSAATTSTTAAERVRPDGPAATFAPLTGGNGRFLLTASTGPDLAAAGYTETEFAASGTATAYTQDGELPADGRLALRPTTSAPYSTRVVVRRPATDAAFNGTMVVEWLNVSSGADASPDYAYLSDELVRKGYAWAGVSAQRIGIEGGDVAVPVSLGIDTGAGKGIRTIDPERYGALRHPGDAYSYDIFTQIGRALRGDSAPGPATDGLEVDRVLAVGESQSAFALTTYANGVQPLTDAFDGFLIHSRGGAGAPLGAPDSGIDITSTVLGPPTLLRTDLDVPTIVVQTETDVLGILNYSPSRQPDTDRLRVWEVAGTAHADRFQIGPVESALGCAGPINNGQQAFVMRAALRDLDEWAAGGDAPPTAEPLAIEESSGSPEFVLDDVGNVTGGVRTPAVEAPTAVLSGLPAEGASIICILMGSTSPLPAEQLATRYPEPDDYATAWAAATDATIDAGFFLPEDRAAIIADARPTGLTPG